MFFHTIYKGGLIEFTLHYSMNILDPFEVFHPVSVGDQLLMRLEFLIISCQRGKFLRILRLDNLAFQLFHDPH